jgi:hypothetical protein
MKKSLVDRQAALGENMGQARGLAALKAMGAVLQPGGAMRGLGNAAGSIADSMEKAHAAEQAEKRSIELMNFNLADAQRKERMGLTKDAMASNTAAEKNKLDAVAAKRAALQAKGGIEARVAQSLRATGGAGVKGPKVNEQLAAAEIAYESDPSEKNLKTVAALRRTADRLRTSESGPGKLGATNEANEIKRTKLYEDALSDLKITPAYKKADSAQKKVMEAETRARIMNMPLPQDGAVTPIKLARGGTITPIKLD